MEEKAYRKTQENILEQFFGDYIKRSRIDSYKIVGIIFMVMLIILMWFPYQSYEGQAIKAVGLMWGVLGSLLYMNMYRFAIDGSGAVTNVYQYLQYLPISKRELKIFRLKKLFRLQKRLYLIAQAGQLLFGLLAYHEVAWGNLLFPLIFAFLAPLLIVGASILLTK